QVEEPLEAEEIVQVLAEHLAGLAEDVRVGEKAHRLLPQLVLFSFDAGEQLVATVVHELLHEQALPLGAKGPEAIGGDLVRQAALPPGRSGVPDSKLRQLIQPR